MNKVIIVGGGAAGMLCSIIAARNGCEVFLYEKNEKLGKKLYITGKGRCNVTNNCEVEDLLRAVMTNSKFLYSAFYTFNSQDMMALLEETGVPLKTERGNRVFPQSDRSSDIIRGLERLMKKYGVHVRFRSEVREILTKDGTATGISLADGEVQNADAVVVATGGLSYPTTGSTGDGYRFARETGHQVTDCIPSLVPLKVKEDYIPRMTGLSLKNVELTVRRGKKILYRDFGEMMFTHTGGKVFYNQAPLKKHTTQSVFDVTNLNSLPKVGIVYSYSNIDPDMVTPLLHHDYKGIIHAGVGNGNFHKNILPVLLEARKKGILVVRSSRVPTGPTTMDAEVDDTQYQFIASQELNPQKSRVLLILGLTKTNDWKQIQQYFNEY